MRSICFRSALLSTISMSILAAGCSGPGLSEDGTDDTASVAEAFSEARCVNAKPDKIFTFSDDQPAFVTPRTYNNPSCGKSYVFEVRGLPARAKKTSAYWDVGVQWGNGLPTQANCSGSEIAMEIYDDDDGGKAYGPWRFQGVWIPFASNGFCQLELEDLRGGFMTGNDVVYVPFPYTDKLPVTFSGRNVRISTTARNPNGTTHEVMIDFGTTSL